MTDPLSRGVPDQARTRTRTTACKCNRCGAELGTLDPGQTVKDLPVCHCRVVRRPASDPHDPVAPERSRR